MEGPLQMTESIQLTLFSPLDQPMSRVDIGAHQVLPRRAGAPSGDRPRLLSCHLPAPGPVPSEITFFMAQVCIKGGGARSPGLEQHCKSRGVRG